MTDQPNDITSVIDEITSNICSGNPLDIAHLQTILALINRDYVASDSEIVEIYKGEKAPYYLAESVVRYQPSRKRRRPRQSKIEYRDSDIAFYFDELRNELKMSEIEAHKKISNESLDRYGESLTKENLPGCIKRGRKFNKKYIEMIAQSAFKDPILLAHLEKLSDSATGKTP